jgi:hypothetical protein
MVFAAALSMIPEEKTLAFLAAVRPWTGQVLTVPLTFPPLLAAAPANHPGNASQSGTQ